MNHKLATLKVVKMIIAKDSLMLSNEETTKLDLAYVKEGPHKGVP